MSYSIPVFTKYDFSVMKDGSVYLNIEDYAMDGESIVFSSARMAAMPIPAWADRKAVADAAKAYMIGTRKHTNDFVVITK